MNYRQMLDKLEELEKRLNELEARVNSVMQEPKSAGCVTNPQDAFEVGCFKQLEIFDKNRNYPL